MREIDCWDIIDTGKALRKPMVLSPRAHQFVRFCRIFSVEEPGHLRAEVLEVDRFCDITVKAGGYAFFDYLRHDIGRERDDGHQGVLVGFLPCADITAGLIPVLSWHMKITLFQMLDEQGTVCDKTYKNQ
jgi:hypothetical protein